MCTKHGPGDTIEGMISCHPRSFKRKPTGTRVPEAQILGEYELLLVPVTGIIKSGNTREYPSNWHKGSPSNEDTWMHTLQYSTMPTHNSHDTCCIFPGRITAEKSAAGLTKQPSSPENLTMPPLLLHTNAGGKEEYTNIPPPSQVELLVQYCNIQKHTYTLSESTCAPVTSCGTETPGSPYMIVGPRIPHTTNQAILSEKCKLKSTNHPNAPAYVARLVGTANVVLKVLVGIYSYGRRALGWCPYYGGVIMWLCQARVAHGGHDEPRKKLGS